MTRRPDGDPGDDMPDDEIVAALRHSPGDPPPMDLVSSVVVAARRRQRRRHAFIAGGSAACVVVVLGFVPGLLRGGATSPVAGPTSSVTYSAQPSSASPTAVVATIVPAPVGSSAPLRCPNAIEDQPAPTRTPQGSGFVPGDPSSAVYCEYDVSHTSGGTTSMLTKHVDLDAGQIEKIAVVAHHLEASKTVPDCPQPLSEQLLTFGYADGAVVTLRVACATVWQGESLHAPAGSMASVLESYFPPPPSEPPAANLSTGVVLELDDNGYLTIVDFGAGSRLAVPLPAPADRADAVVTNPAGGWVVTYRSSNDAASRLALVDTRGKVTPFGPAGLPISGLAVSPDGAWLALALMQETASEPLASIEVLPMPGHTGATRSWPVDKASDVNEIDSLSWAPDGKRLTYIAGSQTGAGFAADPSMLDTTKPGEAPSRSTWPIDDCDENTVAWLGGSGKFAILRECPDASDAYAVVDAATGAASGADIVLPNRGCLGGSIQPSADGSKVLLSRCDEVDLISDGTLALVGQHLRDAAWAG